MRKKKGECPKLKRRWLGPFEVKDVLSAVTYRIQEGKRKPLVVHYDRLKPCQDKKTEGVSSCNTSAPATNARESEGGGEMEHWASRHLEPDLNARQSYRDGCLNINIKSCPYKSCQKLYLSCSYDSPVSVSVPANPVSPVMLTVLPYKSCQKAY